MVALTLEDQGILNGSATVVHLTMALFHVSAYSININASSG